MGIFNKAVNLGKSLVTTVYDAFTGKSSSNRSTSTNNSNNNYSYEPDQVKLAEIRREHDKKLAELELEKIDKIKEAKIELFKNSYEYQVACEEAKTKNLGNVLHILALAHEKLNIIFENKIKIIERASSNIVKEMEEFYLELSDKIISNHDEYTLNKLPNLLELLDKFEVGTPSHNLFSKKIDLDIEARNKILLLQLEKMTERQFEILASITNSKEKLLESNLDVTDFINGTLKEQFSNQLPNLDFENNSNYIEEKEMSQIEIITE